MNFCITTTELSSPALLCKSAICPPFTGINTIHIYDHDSQPRMDSEVREYISSGQVTYDLFEGHHHRYSRGYTSSLERFKHTAQVRQ